MNPSDFIYPEWLRDEVRYLSLLKTAKHAANRGGAFTTSEAVKALADFVLADAEARGIRVSEDGDPEQR